jgi:hypothetical protein
MNQFGKKFKKKKKKFFKKERKRESVNVLNHALKMALYQ